MSHATDRVPHLGAGFYFHHVADDLAVTVAGKVMTFMLVVCALSILTTRPAAAAPPEITAPANQFYNSGQTITPLPITVTDPDGDDVAVTVAGLPSGLTYANGEIRGKVAFTADWGKYEVMIQADDGEDLIQETSFEIWIDVGPPSGEAPEDAIADRGESYRSRSSTAITKSYEPLSTLTDSQTG